MLVTSKQSPLKQSTIEFQIQKEIFHQLDEKSRTRIQVLREIFHTEQEYYNDLCIIVDHFFMTISNRQLVSDEDLQKMFSSIHVIRGISEQLLEKMKEALSTDEEEPSFGSLFSNMSEMMKKYASYVSKQDEALETVEKCRKKHKAFAEFLQVMINEPISRGLPLIAFLIKPTQRVCKYPLLLRELLKTMEDSHFDYENLKEALRVMEETTSYVNEKKREIERQSKMLQVAQVLQGYASAKLITPNRYLVKESIVDKVNVHGKAQKRMMWLFNDLLLYAAPSVSGNTFVYKDSIPAKVCLASPVVGSASTFELTRLDKVKKYKIIAETEEEMNMWVSVIMKQYEQSQG